MTRKAVALRYAKALVQVGAADQERSALGRELEMVLAATRLCPELRGALESPAFAPESRKRVADELAQRLRLSRLVRNTLAFLIDRGRMDQFPAIVEAYHALADEAAGRIRAQVRTAAPLSEARLQELRAALARATGREVQVSEETAPALLGGLVVQIGDTVYDGSLRSQLQTLGERLRRAGL